MATTVTALVLKRFIVSMVITLMVALVTGPLARVTAQDDPNFSIAYMTVSDCKTSVTDNYHEFFNISHMVCTPCSQNSSIQTVSEDGLSCVCLDTFEVARNNSANPDIRFQCSACPTDEYESLDKWNCVTCTTTPQPPPDTCPACDSPLTVDADRTIVGDWLTSSTNQSTLTCVQCTNDTAPNEDGTRCTRCNQYLSVQPPVPDGCTCPADRQAGGLCFNNTADLIPDSLTLYTINYDVDVTLQSAFFQDNLRAAQAICTNFSQADPTRYDYSNLTACQLLGNLCVLTMHTTAFPPPNSNDDACSLFDREVNAYPDSTFPPHGSGYRTTSNQLLEWKANMPWLYYDQDTNPPEDILADKGIDAQFDGNALLQFRSATYSLDGQYLGIDSITNGALQMCKDDNQSLNAAFLFGTEYSTKCALYVDYLFDAPAAVYRQYFYDLYLEYTDAAGNLQLYAIPLLNTNYSNANQVLVNQDPDQTNWQLMRRLFLVDRVTGVEQGASSPTVIRYVKDMQFNIKLQDNDGRIYPPYVSVTYDYVTSDSYGQNASVETSFGVSYSMDMGTIDTDMSIALGVMSALAVVYAALKTASWSKRDGRVAIDFFTLLKFLLFAADILANAFFVTILGFSLWWLIFYKSESAMYLILDSKGDYYIKAYIGSAFALKCISMIHILVVQCTTDIFFVDWERPRKDATDDFRPVQSPAASSSVDPGASGTTSTGATTTTSHAIPRRQKHPVSIWRTHMVANEWSEIQTWLRINVFFELLVLLIILFVADVENVSRYQTISVAFYSSDAYQPPYNRVLRFGLSASIYALLAVVLWLAFRVVLYNRFIDHPLLNFVDLCSTANVSVFVMAHQQFGYYIHGRSVHGTADVGLKQMYEDINREQDDLCGQRGLIPNTDHQTFEVFVSRILRKEYDKVLQKALQKPAAGRGGRAAAAAEGSRLAPEQETKIEAYKVLNRFLCNYIQHNLKKADYIIVEKTVVERFLGMETQHNEENMGYFYRDFGHSFDNVLFYGEEVSLQIFEILWFSVMDLAAEDFVLAAFLTYIMHGIVWRIRAGVGKNNISQKTMIDKRFLI